MSVKTHLGAHITRIATRNWVQIPLANERVAISIDIIKEQCLEEPNVARFGAI